MYDHLIIQYGDGEEHQTEHDLREVTGEHKNAAAIKAWADGQQIQFRVTPNLEWTDWRQPSDGRTPYFNSPGVEWRAKPKTDTLWYTNALYFNGIKYWVEAVMADEFSLDLSQDKEFVRCIGDWQCVEVEK